MKLLGIELLDFLVVVVYLIGICALGVWMVRRVKDTSDFFIGNWRFGKALLMMHTFGTGTSSEMPVAVVSNSFKGGFSGIWTQWLYLFITPFYWLFAPWYRRMRCVTGLRELGAEGHFGDGGGHFWWAAQCRCDRNLYGRFGGNLWFGRRTRGRGHHRLYPGAADNRALFYVDSVRAACGWRF
jgi:hypothetical protein